MDVRQRRDAHEIVRVFATEQNILTQILVSNNILSKVITILRILTIIY